MVEPREENPNAQSRWRRWVLRLFLRRYWGRMGSVLNALKRQQGDGGRTEALEQQGDGKA